MQAQGEFAQVKEKLESALDLAGQPVKRGTMAHKHIVYMMLADAAAQLRDEAALAKYTPLLQEMAERDGHQAYLAVAHRAWGVANRLNGQHLAAEELLLQALSIFEERQSQWQVGRTLVELAELALALGDEPSARDQYARALDAFESLGAMAELDRTRTALAALN